MKFLVKLALLALFLTPFGVSMGVSTQANFYRNQETGNMIVGLSDAHMDIPGGQATAQHQDDLITVANALDAHVVIEDMLTVPINTLQELGANKEGIEQLTQFYQNVAVNPAPLPQTIHLAPVNRYQKNAATPSDDTQWQKAFMQSPLCQLERKLREANLSVYNAEFRHAYGLSLEGYSIPITDVLKLNEGIFELCKPLATATESLQKLYQETLDNYSQCPLHKLFNSMIKKNPAATMLDAQNNQDTPLDFYDCELLNLLILNNVVRNQHKKTMIVYAGATHMKAILPLLPDLGYEEVADSCIGHDQIIDEENCRGIIPVIDMKDLITITRELRGGDDNQQPWWQQILVSTSLVAPYFMPLGYFVRLLV